MEVAIPIIALGAMYVMSNQDKRESFHQREPPYKKEEQLPNTNIPPVNYPVQTYSELPANVKYYENANTATDKYYQQDAYEKAINKDELRESVHFQSLTGDIKPAKALKHNNMVPFFGSHVTQRTVNLDGNESTLDNMQGAGSQQIRKVEQAPLFAPQKNMGWAHGTPNMSDFMQSRVNPARNMSNVKPFESTNVGPGLNRGYTTVGSGGYNSGMEARERWIAKSVDELRVKTNPKVTYGGVVLGAKRAVQNRGIQGNVEKYRPDTFFINGPERYFTTPGQEKAPKVRSEEILKSESRTSTTREYFGTGERDNEGTYIPGKYEQPHRPVLKPNSDYPGPAERADAWSSCEGKSPCDYGKSGYNVLANERSLTEDRGGRFGSVAGSVIGAVIAPIMDVLRPSRKENVIGNARPTGNMAGPDESYVYNPADRARTTTRETTAANPYPLQINNQRPGGGYKTNPQQAKVQQRDNTNCYYVGDAGNTAGTSNAPTYNAAYNAHLNATRSSVTTAPRGNDMLVGNMGLFQGTQNISVVKSDEDRLNPAIMPGVRGNALGSGTLNYGEISSRPRLDQGINCQRTQPEILNAFRCNPYTQSLESSA